VAIGWRAVVAAFLLASVGCRRENPSATDALAGSLIFDNASADMREALATSVDYRITEDNFARWQDAQANLEQLPRSAMWSGPSSGRSAIDRAISRLESSPSSRTAIESAGISVRDFVIETIALAQATEGAQTGKSTSPTPILADNDRFVRGYGSRILRAEAEESQPDATGQGLETQADEGQTNDIQPDDVQPDDLQPDDLQPEIIQLDGHGDMKPGSQLKMFPDMRDQERLVMRMQMEAMLAARMAEMRSQRDLRRLQERIQRRVDAVLGEYDRKRFRARRDHKRNSRRDSFPDSLPDSR
jgi:hypothetical protein